MSKAGRTRRQGATRRRLEASGQSRATAARKLRAEREAEVAAGGGAAGLAGEQAAGPCEDTVDLREEAADLREEAADRREEAATIREMALRPKEQAARATAALSALTEAELREANENLVTATVHAQTMAEQMSYMADHDFLTGLPNRSLLMDRVAQAIARAKRHGNRVALMYLDLDQFKHVNDSLGHSLGDELLRSVARRLQASVRLSDTVSRQGGDEFVVLLPEVEQVHDAAHTADKLSAAIAKPHVVGDHEIHVTMSIGISLYPDDGEDVEALLRNADTAMYHAKRKGRNNWQLFTEDMHVRASARQSVVGALRHGLDQREFVLHYQPQVTLATGVVTGAEALLRLRRSDRPLLHPEHFMSVAEDSGLIVPIGRWVLREACRQTQAWLQAGHDLGRIAVNVSAKEIHNREFLAGVRTILDDTGLDPRRLELELTESGLIQDVERMLSTLHALKELGVRIAVDDFGTGYSSLSHLRRFPIDTLKIDQSFVQDIDRETGKAIVGAVIAMGMSLEQRVVAEGVETRQQNAFLQSHHCAEGQGYLFGRPVEAGDFAWCGQGPSGAPS